MKYRQLKTDFWDDGYVQSLNPLEKLVFIYLFTNPKVNMTGIYELTDRTICHTLGVRVEELQNIKEKFAADQKYTFYKDYVFINKFHKHNIYSSADAVYAAFLRDFEDIPTEIRAYFICELELDYKIPLKPKKDNVMVMDKVKDKYGRVYPRLELKNSLEVVNPDDIPL